MTTVLLKFRIDIDGHVYEINPGPALCEELGAYFDSYLDTEGQPQEGWFLEFDSREEFVQFYRGFAADYSNSTINGQPMLVIYI